MGDIYNSIVGAAKLIDTDIMVLSHDVTRKYLEALSFRYADGSLNWLWEHLKDGVSGRDSEAWKWVGEFTTGKGTLMLFNQRDESAGFYFNDGSQIVPILAETFGYEFYLTDRNLSFFLCFNYHDYLIGAGSAKDWLKQQIH